jgi:DNA-binding transcriptional LysR family regulator
MARLAGRARVRVSAMQGLTDGLLPRLILSFQQRHPAVSVSVRAQIMGEAESDLASGDADIGLAHGLTDEPGLHDSRAFRTRPEALVAAQIPLAGRSDLRLSDPAAVTVALAGIAPGRLGPDETAA